METRKTKNKRLIIILSLVCAGIIIATALGFLFSSLGEDTALSAEANYDSSVLSAYQANDSGVVLTADETESADESLTTAINDVYWVAKKEIDQKYNALFNDLLQNANAQIEQIVADILGEEYTALIEQYADLENQYNKLVSDFYSSAEYVALKSEIDSKISELTALTRNSEEYNAKVAEVVALYNQVRTLATDVNIQIAELNTAASAIIRQINSLITANYNAILEQAQPVIAQFNADLKALNTAKSAEIKLLQDTLGIDTTAEFGCRYGGGMIKRGRR